MAKIAVCIEPFFPDLPYPERLASASAGWASGTTSSGSWTSASTARP